MAGPEAKLAKLRIQSHKMDEDPEPNNSANLGASDGAVFEAFYNPNSFASEYAIEYDAEQNYGDLKISAKFKKYTPTSYSFSLMIDGTGASIPDGLSTQLKSPLPSDFVTQKVEEFKKVAYNYDGEEHRPKFLSLTWGTTHVPRVVLTGFSLNHDLFRPDGSPLRATIACKFQEYSYRELTEAEKKKASPDMTHERVVQQGDRLPLMCEKIYGDSRLYLQVARFNDLKDYRNLKPGQRLYFPPLTNSKG